MQKTIQKSRLWVFTTSLLLSFNGGLINAICLVSFLKNAVGYVTGNLTYAGIYLEQGNNIIFFDLMILVCCFLLGSIISGLTIRTQNFNIDRSYLRMLLLQFVIMLLVILLLAHQSTKASYLLALVMGMQNAMTTHYGTALIRTTHMTGTTTDLGILISRWLKGDDFELWKFKLYLFLILGFTAGTFIGTFTYSHFHAFSLIASLFIYMLMGAIGLFEVYLQKPRGSRSFEHILKFFQKA